MLYKARVVIICLIIALELDQTYSKTLGVPIKNDDGEQKNPITTYYRHNIFGPNTYAFGFEVNDKVTGNIQFRDERRYANGTIQGSYGYVRPDGSVMVTHFMADREMGYLSQSQNFQPGDEPKWQENWPTKKPNILMEKPLESIQPTVVYDDQEKLNLTSVLLPVEVIKEEHGLDLNPPDLEKELVNPVVLEVINGEVPLVTENKKKQNSLGFETVHQFIPPDFPIVPFELPHEEQEKEDVKLNVNEDLGTKPVHILETTNGDKYDQQKINNSEKTLTLDEEEATDNDKYVKSQGNNDEKSLPTEAINIKANNKSDTASIPQARSINFNKNSDWYDKIIRQTRHQYLDTVQ
ncbi:uncharacterized protein ACRADG_001220 isoform 1-T1 [Cochliomyia hominivorax]